MSDQKIKSRVSRYFYLIFFIMALINEIKRILNNVENFKSSDNKEDFLGIIEQLISFSNEPGINLMDLKEQLYLIKFEIDN